MKTKYSIVRDSIKTKILNGTYQPNQRISSESELMKEFNVSRHTVRQAIGDLVTKGWLYRVQGSGTFCADMSRDLNKRNVTRTKNIAMITTYIRSEEHTSELQSRGHLVCRLLLEKKRSLRFCIQRQR